LSKDRVVQKDKPAIVLSTHIHTTNKKKKNLHGQNKEQYKKINFKNHNKYITIKKENALRKAAQNKVDFLICRMV